MGTRLRAIIVTSIVSLLAFLLIGRILDVDTVFAQWGISDSVAVNFILAVWLGFILTVGVWWVLFFKRKGNSLIAVGMFPGMAIIPYLLLVESIINSLFSGIEQIPLAFLASFTLWIIVYLLILTSNVLNGAILFGIPLGQAGKAAQFIFSLISCYFLMAYLFSSGMSIEVKLILSGLFIFFFCYSGIWLLQIPARQVLLSALAISLTMVLIIFVMSVWPISSVYGTLVIVVVFYILLNVALEVREKIGKVIWIEYFVLVFLIVFILLTNGNWGVNGTLI